MRHAPLLLLTAMLSGCSKTVTEDDCRKIADQMLDIWQTETKQAVSAEGVSGERAAGIIKSEGEQLASDWSVECKKEMIGRRVDPKEIECLLKAKRIEQVNKCSEP